MIPSLIHGLHVQATAPVAVSPGQSFTLWLPRSSRKSVEAISAVKWASSQRPRSRYGLPTTWGAPSEQALRRGWCSPGPYGRGGLVTWPGAVPAVRLGCHDVAHVVVDGGPGEPAADP